MKYWKLHLTIAAGILAMAYILGGVLAQPLWAQVRAALVRDVDHPARQAVTIRRFTDANIFETAYTVPAGKKLVVEQMNCSALGTGSVYVGIFQGGLAHSNIVYSVPFVGAGSSVRILDGQTRLYFEPGAALNLRIFTSDPTTCTISGFTVDAAQ